MSEPFLYQRLYNAANVSLLEKYCDYFSKQILSKSNCQVYEEYI